MIKSNKFMVIEMQILLVASDLFHKAKFVGA